MMYRQQQGWGGAYKLLNATGRVGSQGGCALNSRALRHGFVCSLLHAIAVMRTQLCWLLQACRLDGLQ